MSDFVHLLAVLCAHTIPGALACVIARKKGYSSAFFWAGFFLSIIGVIWALCLRKKSDRDMLKP